MAQKFTADQIKRFPQAHYEINVEWGYLEAWLADQFSNDEVELDPDFQRAHVWHPWQQSAYCEFILRGGESSRILYWNHPEWGAFRKTGRLTLVDGKQRLEAVRAFLRNEVSVFGGLYLRDMEPRILRKTCVDFRMRIAKLPTRREMIEWYLMINAGGTPHTGEELQRVRALLDAEP